MSDDEPTFDEDDLRFINSIIPDGSIPVGMFCVIQFFDPEGVMRWRRYHPFDAPVSQAAGIAFIGILGMLGASDTGIEWTGGDEE